MKRRSNSNSGNDFPEKKDLTYWIIILILFLIFSFILYQVNPRSVNAQLSLLSTLLSIALAIIAIIFSFIQSSASSNQLNDISISSTEIIEKFKVISQDMKELKDVSKVLEKYNQDLFSRYEEISDLLKQLRKAKTDGQRKELQKKLDTIFNNEVNSEISVPLTDRTLYNTIKAEFGNEWILIQSVWKLLHEKGITITISKLKEKINDLEYQGNAIVSEDERRVKISKHYQK